MLRVKIKEIIEKIKTKTKKFIQMSQHMISI